MPDGGSLRALLRGLRRIPARIRSERRPLRFLAARLLWSSRLCEFLSIDLPGGYRMRFHASSVSAALWVDPQFRSEDTRFVRDYLRPGDTFVDVGANVGQLTIVGAARVGPTGRAIAVEPHRRTCAFLRRNLALNGLEVEVHEVAIGRAEGESGISDLRSDDQNFVDPTATGGRVPLVTLDALLGSAHVDLLKIDVEGYELAVLAGAERTLARCDCLYIEDCDANLRRFGASSRELRTALRAAGFLLYRATPSGLRPTAEAAADHLENLVAVRGDRLAAVAARIGPLHGSS
jgi:FkbM family methyltransferase